MTKWVQQLIRRREDVSTVNSAAWVVLILALVVLIPQHKVFGHVEDGAHHDENHEDGIEIYEHHLHHHPPARKLAVCEEGDPNCAEEHGGEESAAHHHGSPHAHSHIDHDHHHGEAVGEKQSPNCPICAHEHGGKGGAESHQHDSHPHAHSHSDHDHHHGEGQAHSHLHSHSEEDHHDDHDHHHHHEGGDFAKRKKPLGKKFGHGHHGHGDEFESMRSHSHFGHDHHHDHHHTAEGKILTTLGLWVRAMGCSLLVSLASLVCLIFLPLIVTGGKPSRPVVDALSGFGAGCMLGDALLHQIPHAFSGGHGHSHDHHSHEHEGEKPHGHSLEDLSVGLAVIAGILLFFLVEKIVRATQDHHGHGHSHSHSHGLHRSKKKDDEEITPVETDASKESEKHSDSGSGIRKRKGKSDPSSVVKGETPAVGGKKGRDPSGEQEGHEHNFVLSYLNLFSDGVHNFTDGMALGSAFLLHGTVGGWSRTLFLLAHELPQEVGDFGILLRSGFGVVEALAFNFLSALMALAGTALALLVKNPGHSSLIEGFTAGGFIYIAVGAVMPDMHSQSQSSSLKTSLSQFTALSLGIGAAILISLAE